MPVKSVLVIAVFVALFLGACNTPEKLLCRTWKPSDIDFDETKLYYDRGMKNDIIAQLKDTMLFTFNKDHTYSLRLPDRTEQGTWRFSARHDTLFTNYEHGGSSSKINSLTKEFLNAESVDANGISMKFILVPVNSAP